MSVLRKRLDEPCPAPRRRFPLLQSTSRLRLTCLSHQDIQSHIDDCCELPHVSESEELADSTGNAFSVLMSSCKANDAWEEAEMADDRSFRPSTKVNGERRKAPFYKVMQDMPFAVDYFCYVVIPGVTSYFLTYRLDR